MKHIPVFYEKVIQALDIDPNGIYLDATLGAGGHATGISTQLEQGKLLAFDLDVSAIEHFRNRFKDDQDKYTLFNDNFANMQDKLDELSLRGKLNGVIADLGWSTDQLHSMPGLSYQQDEQILDMRFNQSLQKSARDLLNTASYKQLTNVFSEFGGFVGKELQQLAKGIVEQRKSGSFTTVGDFNRLLENVPSHRQHNIKTRAYQALRIAVNQEYANLQRFMEQSFENLVDQGRLIIITFHSGEEEIVENYLQQKIDADQAENLFDHKFIRPTVAELRENIHSHSAKLWGITKYGKTD